MGSLLLEEASVEPVRERGVTPGSLVEAFLGTFSTAKTERQGHKETFIFCCSSVWSFTNYSDELTCFHLKPAIFFKDVLFMFAQFQQIIFLPGSSFFLVEN